MGASLALALSEGLRTLRAMARRNDPPSGSPLARQRIRTAKLEGSARAVADKVALAPERAAEARQAWPELWERLDALIDVVES